MGSQGHPSGWEMSRTGGCPGLGDGVGSDCQWVPIWGRKCFRTRRGAVAQHREGSKCTDLCTLKWLVSSLVIFTSIKEKRTRTHPFVHWVLGGQVLTRPWVGDGWRVRTAELSKPGTSEASSSQGPAPGRTMAPPGKCLPEGANRPASTWHKPAPLQGPEATPLPWNPQEGCGRTEVQPERGPGSRHSRQTALTPLSPSTPAAAPETLTSSLRPRSLLQLPCGCVHHLLAGGAQQEIRGEGRRPVPEAAGGSLVP